MLLFGCTQPTPPGDSPPHSDNPFEKLSDTSCSEYGKPIIRYFSTTWCPHCQYINPVFNEVMEEYGDKIIALHYEIDITTPSETEMAEFTKFSPNQNIPAFSFGCQYYRIGNSYEATRDTNSEKQEFRRVINLLLAESTVQ